MFQAHVEERGQSGLGWGSVGGVGGEGCWNAREDTADQIIFAVQDGEGVGERAWRMELAEVQHWSWR